MNLRRQQYIKVFNYAIENTGKYRYSSDEKAWQTYYHMGNRALTKTCHCSAMKGRRSV